MMPTFVKYLFVAVAALATSCACSKTSDYLTIGAVSYDEQYYSSTTPKWDGVYEHPASLTFQASLVFGLEDPPPGTEAFEFFAAEGGELRQIELQRIVCGDEGTEETCRLNDVDAGQNCPYNEWVWQPTEELVEGASYLLVFYPTEGNGRELSWDSDREQFNGREALTMDLTVTAPIAPL